MHDKTLLTQRLEWIRVGFYLTISFRCRLAEVRAKNCIRLIVNAPYSTNNAAVDETAFAVNESIVCPSLIMLSSIA